MKLLVIWFCMLITSCSPFLINTQDYKINSMGLDSAWLKTSGFEYIDETTNYWKSPTEFEKDGGGDCEDFSVYLVYLLGTNAVMIGVSQFGPAKTYHTLVKYQDKYLEPQNYGRFYSESELTIIAQYSYYVLMTITTNFGTKSLEAP